MLRALPDDAGPAGFIGLVDIALGAGGIKLDRLDTGLGLALGVGGVRLGEVAHTRRLAFRSGLLQHRLLLRRQLVPGGLVDDHRDLRGIEARIDAVLGLLVPAEIEDAGDGPAIAVDHAALERGVDLARRGLHHGGAHRLEEVAIDRGDAQLEAGEVGARDLLVEIEVERIVADHIRQEDSVHLLRIEAGHVVEAAVLAQLGHRNLPEFPGIGLRHHVGVESAGRVGDIDDTVLERVADFKRRHGLRAADVVDADDALARLVHALDEALEAARIGSLLGEGGDGAQGDFLCRRGGCKAQY